MVSFGEVVFPTSRALWDLDDDEDFIASDNKPLEWEGNTNIPEDINTLLIVETFKLIEFARMCLIDANKIICKITEAKVEIQKMSESNYLILCDDVKDITPGEITDKLIPWLENSKYILTLTSVSSHTYIKKSYAELPSSFIRALSTKNIQKFHAPWLHMPNLLTGTAAGVLSYCNQKGLDAILYACFMDSLPLDSTTVKPIIELLQKHDIKILNPYRMKAVHNSSNLYM